MQKLFNENRDFRFFLIFSTFYGVGSGIFGIFMMWVIHAMYQNPMYTGIAGFAFSVPAIASFIIGPFVDRWNKIKVVRASCFIRSCMVLVLIIVPYFYSPSVWFFHLAILVFSISGVFSAPAFAALLPRIVDSEDLVKANALMSIVGIMGGASVGVVLYMLMVRGAGFELVYTVNVVVLIMALLSSFLVRNKEQKNISDKSDKNAIKIYLGELKSGFAFIKKGVLLPIVIAIVSMNFFAEVSYVNIPMFAELHLGTASGYIILSAFALAGGVVGSYISRIVETKFELWKLLVVGFILTGIVRIIFVRVIPNNFTRALLIYILYVGLGSMLGIFYGTLIQKLPPKHLIGRVATVFTSLVAIAIAIGAIIGGLAGTLLPDVDMVLIIQGCSYIVIGLCLCLSGRIRKLPKISDIGVAEQK
ncbi:MAG: MFS transporter [Defluviitaleaceae bacterium]|nr:MFS transporter [Defluviitaleaceae bacterium]